jgi:hypothetical protein
LPEFLEYLARISCIKAKEGDTFIERLKNVLDSVLEVICADRIETALVAVEQSESEDEY